MEPTQRMCASPAPSDDSYVDENASVLYARLRLTGGDSGGAGETFDVFGGENKIGRDEDECNIFIPNKVSAVFGLVASRETQIWIFTLSPDPLPRARHPGH